MGDTVTAAACAAWHVELGSHHEGVDEYSV